MVLQPDTRAQQQNKHGDDRTKKELMKKQTQRNAKPWRNGAAVLEPTSREQILHDLQCLLFPSLLFFWRRLCCCAGSVCFVLLDTARCVQVWMLALPPIRQLESWASAMLTDGPSCFPQPRRLCLGQPPHEFSHRGSPQNSHRVKEVRGRNIIYSTKTRFLKATLFTCGCHVSFLFLRFLLGWVHQMLLHVLKRPMCQSF